MPTFASVFLLILFNSIRGDKILAPVLTARGYQHNVVPIQPAECPISRPIDLDNGIGVGFY